MSAVSFREKNMLLIVGVLALYAIAALSYKKQAENWKIARRTYQTAVKKFQDENALIASRAEWRKKYEEMRSLMPVFPYEKDVDTHWLNVMDSVAQRNDLTISRRQTGREEEVGDVYELPIECKDWEGTLEALVKFLYDMNKEGAMLDVRQLYIRPSPRAGYLTGTFTLYCAYMRDDVDESESTPDKEEPADDAKPADGAKAADGVKSADQAADGESEDETDDEPETDVPETPAKPALKGSAPVKIEMEAETSPAAEPKTPPPAGGKAPLESAPEPAAKPVPEPVAKPELEKTGPETP